MGILGSSESEIVAKILETLSNSSGEELASLKSRMNFSGQILPLLLWLNSMNFVEREEVTTRYPMIRAKWRITSAGRAYLSFTSIHQGAIPYSFSPVHVLLVAPPPVKRKMKGISATDLHEAIADLLASAKREILVSSPYIDEVIVPLLRNAPDKTSIKILTEDASKPFFRRLIDSRPETEVRYLRVTDKEVQLFQIHAKFVCVDRGSAIITSANINERSMFYNIEVGVLVSDPKVCTDLADVFDGIFEQAKKLQ